MTRVERRKLRARRHRIRITAVLGILVVVLLTASWAADEADDAPSFGAVAPGSEKEQTVEVLPLWFSEEAEMKMTVKKDVVATEALMETEEEAPSYQSDAVPLNHDTQAQVLGWCEEYGVPYSVALAVIEAESSFRPDAENGSCYGYMQINSINKSWLFQEIGVTNLEDPLQNLHSGIYMLGDLYGKYGDWHKALVCYNCGETGAYNHYFSQGLTSSGYSRHVMELEAKWAEVVSQ
ncbi:lytic transglycosylase domain-containing protein [Clostridium sp. DFI.5.61]|uniref:transglycosylase SLT domain-containing protein n=1 Tax=Clostridium sp. DFI.5.61 TaxID=2965279 RepID=UPI0021090559|nr:lytic transglycosylase domain-containing protein [bacterium 210820-DFI.5.26]MCQ5157500.1 lytic transglycosylase domain-containing protein [Clostridium sp. DFI.5.61]